MPRERLDEPGLGLTGTTWTRVSPKLVWTELITTVVIGVVVTAGCVLIGIVSGGFGRTAGAVWLSIAIVVFVIAGITAALTPRRVRAIGYALRDDDLVLRRGLMWQRFTAVPYGRMQLVDVNRGPLDRVLGMSELKFVTAAASTNVRIPGIPFVDADDLRDRLVELAESRRAGL
ncbi:PH domain-containing protein [Curtobacterium sp. MCPF17_002]|jgi:membrane protein YdbS with pleckstrin-like domain|uniref:PH domain-containing protein n=1 Tax=Curtobacterium sp. MCPF17_002 TaxID=2175645 RepID=UPI000DA8B10E|nr:PH domain-containing protein [Curtobacterium sp. MCPF17_002]WIB77674.1 PH domain-containing protein [Curtobacterium sp. MCPF17_002]